MTTDKFARAFEDWARSQDYGGCFVFIARDPKEGKQRVSANTRSPDAIASMLFDGAGAFFMDFIECRQYGE